MQNAINWFKIMEKIPITPEIGYFARFMDTEGNQVAIHSMK